MNNKDSRILIHIIEYCDKLLTFTSGMSYIDFQQSELHKDACSLCILQIGELVSNLTDEFKENHKTVPWRQIRSMRNIVAHHYGEIDAETLWDVIVDDIPSLKEYCEGICSNT